MPSPFPGMDPFIESQEWSDFPTRFIASAGDAIAPSIGPKYVARVERRIYVEHDEEERRRWVGADVAVIADDRSGSVSAESATATLASPVECIVPMPVEQREAYLIIRRRDTAEVVTIIECLSPGNKRPGSDGRREYLNKRDNVIESRTHLVELDLLRGGARLPLSGPVPEGDYYAIVSREHRRPKVEVYAWTMRKPLPMIPIPLLRGDDDARLDLQAVVSGVYDRARYDYSLNYQAALDPPLDKSRIDEATWLEKLLVSQQTSN